MVAWKFEEKYFLLPTTLHDFSSPARVSQSCTSRSSTWTFRAQCFWASSPFDELGSELRKAQSLDVPSAGGKRCLLCFCEKTCNCCWVHANVPHTRQHMACIHGLVCERRLLRVLSAGSAGFVKFFTPVAVRQDTYSCRLAFSLQLDVQEMF